MPDPKQNPPNEPERQWHADDDRPAEDPVFRDDELFDDEDELDALLDMQAREKRRDQYFRVGGDDHSPGIDSDMDANAPKDLDRD